MKYHNKKIKIIEIFGLWHKTNIFSMSKSLRVYYKITDHRPLTQRLSFHWLTDHRSPTHRLSSHQPKNHQQLTNRPRNHWSPTTDYPPIDHWPNDDKLVDCLSEFLTAWIIELFYHIYNYLRWWKFLDSIQLRIWINHYYKKVLKI